MKRLFITLFFVASSLLAFAGKSVPRSLFAWQKSETVRWNIYDQRAAEASCEGWKDKFGSLAERIDQSAADLVWGRIEQAKIDFHQANLWILTSGNDSLAAAMIDVEWAMDGIFIGYFTHVPGTNNNRIRSFSAKGIDDAKFNELYNIAVAPKVKALLAVGGLECDMESESVHVAEAVKRWTSYNTVKWNNSDSAVAACPDKYLKGMGRGHNREDVRTEWVRVQNTISDFNNATLWLRAKENKTINAALDDCTQSLMKYFTKYAKGMKTDYLAYETYSEVMRIAVDVLCMEYANVVKADKNAAKAPKKLSK